MAKEASVIAKPPFYIASPLNESIAIAINGLIAGLLIWGLSYLISQFVITPIFCQTADSEGICASAPAIAYSVATVVVSVGALFSLARIGVFRPLLVVVASAVAFWDLPSVLVSVSSAAAPYEQILTIGILYAIAYLLFSWILRLRSFLVSVVLMIAIIVAIRFTLLS